MSVIPAEGRDALPSTWGSGPGPALADPSSRRGAAETGARGGGTGTGPHHRRGDLPAVLPARGQTFPHRDSPWVLPMGFPTAPARLYVFGVPPSGVGDRRAAVLGAESGDGNRVPLLVH